ncbi:MAG: HPF/RaiA family ribosome-associated protein, partial [Thermotoga sp.]
LLQMETMDHMFLVFRNIDTGEINLLFRKDEKKYGLIEFYE